LWTRWLRIVYRSRLARFWWLCSYGVQVIRKVFFNEHLVATFDCDRADRLVLALLKEFPFNKEQIVYNVYDKAGKQILHGDTIVLGGDVSDLFDKLVLPFPPPEGGEKSLQISINSYPVAEVYTDEMVWWTIGQFPFGSCYEVRNAANARFVPF
jgi:hypothetical protein